MPGTLTEQLAALGRGGPTARSGTADEALVLADRPDGTVVRIGAVICKAHAADCDPAALAVRLRVAAHPRLRSILLPPLPVSRTGGLLEVLHDGRAATLWPAGAPVAVDDARAAPWEEAAALLARLHDVSPGELPEPLPSMRGPAKVARAVARLRAVGAESAAAGTVLGAWAGLPPWARGEAAPPRRDHLCHGDLHLGQLVRHPAPDGPWLLIDVDDLGLGNAAWDLARPAAWYAAGLLAPAVWQRFLRAYCAGGGAGLRSADDPWPELDIPARALTVQSAALALVRAARERRAPDDVDQALVDACSRIVRLGSEAGP
ncbi:phosphotransferase family protein [Streptomyces sp. KR80]|uniref:phosphotransferase family protein n=1 Tax=Streptomyces sp. KR80 TaxID=3457426 RepID=UPI003FCFE4BD